jgi:hypothetical protein
MYGRYRILSSFSGLEKALGTYYLMFQINQRG